MLFLNIVEMIAGVLIRVESCDITAHFGDCGSKSKVEASSATGNDDSATLEREIKSCNE